MTDKRQGDKGEPERLDAPNQQVVRPDNATAAPEPEPPAEPKPDKGDKVK